MRSILYFLYISRRKHSPFLTGHDCFPLASWTEDLEELVNNTYLVKIDYLVVRKESWWWGWSRLKFEKPIGTKTRTCIFAHLWVPRIVRLQGKCGTVLGYVGIWYAQLMMMLGVGFRSFAPYDTSGGNHSFRYPSAHIRPDFHVTSGDRPGKYTVFQRWLHLYQRTP